MKSAHSRVVQELPVEAEAAHLLVRHRLDHRDRHRGPEPSEVDPREFGLLRGAHLAGDRHDAGRLPFPTAHVLAGEVGRVEAVDGDCGVGRGSMSSAGRPGRCRRCRRRTSESPSSSTGSMNSGNDTAMRTARATVTSGWVRGPRTRPGSLRRSRWARTRGSGISARVMSPSSSRYAASSRSPRTMPAKPRPRSARGARAAASRRRRSRVAAGRA